MTKREQLSAIRDGIRAGLASLEKQIDELPDKPRPVTKGWKIWEYGALSLTRLDRNGELAVHICEVLKSGLKIHNTAHAALDGIAHDEKGRIKVVGYVNVEDLKDAISRQKLALEMLGLPRLEKIIDELAG